MGHCGSLNYQCKMWIKTFAASELSFKKIILKAGKIENMSKIKCLQCEGQIGLRKLKIYIYRRLIKWWIPEETPGGQQLQYTSSINHDETDVPWKHASIAHQKVFARLESFCAKNVFAPNGQKFHPAFPEKIVVYLKRLQFTFNIFRLSGNIFHCMDSFQFI